MKRFGTLFIIALIICFSNTTMAAVKIKLGVVTKPGSAQNIVAEKFKELIEQRSKDNIMVHIFDSASLGNEAEILQKVQMNTVQMAIVTGGPFDTFDSMASVINYSFHIDVASLQWWQTLNAETQKMIQEAMHEAAVFQRKDNRSKNAARLKFLKEKGMQVEEHPDIDVFRSRVADLKDMDIYRDPKVQALLIKVLDATK